MWNSELINVVNELKEQSILGGGKERNAKQHKMGKLTARERLLFLFDKGTFTEIGSIRKSTLEEAHSVPGDGVITGYGKINGKNVFASSQDFSVHGGTLGSTHSEKICRIMDMAFEARCPYIAINDSGGARIEEGINSLHGYSGVFYRNTKASGVIPQIAVVMGPCAGGACYSPAISDFVFMVRNTSKMFITGPVVVNAVTGENTTPEKLGGASVHEMESGVAHFVFEDEYTCLEGVKRLLSYLPQSNGQATEKNAFYSKKENESFEKIVPDNSKKPYDVHLVIDTIVDDDSFYEVQKEFAKNIIVGLSRLNGSVVGIVANQPMVAAGVIDIDASDKAARFVRFCDCFNIPILTLVDVPGYLPGIKQEHLGIIRHGAKLLFAFAEATVPKICLIMRKAYGGAYIAMNSKGLGADFVYAWPISQLAVMGAKGAVDILYKQEIQSASVPIKKVDELIDNYEKTYLNPIIAAEKGYIDEIIDVNETRKRIIEGFSVLEYKNLQAIHKKHGNIPL